MLTIGWCSQICIITLEKDKDVTMVASLRGWSWRLVYSVLFHHTNGIGVEDLIGKEE
jgi:hypothetical protein